MRPGPTTWFVGPDGADTGLDYELALMFSKRRGLPLRVVAAENPAQLIADTMIGAAHVAAGGLYRHAADPPAAGDKLLYSSGYYTVEPALIYNSDSFRPESWSDLTGERVAIIEGTGLETALAPVRARHSEVKWRPLALPATDVLIEQVADGDVDYAFVASNEIAVARNLFPNVGVAFSIGLKLDQVWALPPSQRALRDEVNAFFEQVRSDGTLQRLVERYFGFTRRVERIDATMFRERIETLLPLYRSFFYQAQQQTGIDWRLCAAIAYQESHWNPLATSETNVRGLMMLTEDTAKRMRVTDRLDARQSIIAGARYIAELKRSLPERIGEPDRTWIALAAFNIGIAHLEDARVLAAKRKLNPDSWSDVKKTLPLLAQPDTADFTRYGYARGGQAVVFVETVRVYYDVLLRLEKPYYGAQLRAGGP